MHVIMGLSLSRLPSFLMAAASFESGPLEADRPPGDRSDPMNRRGGGREIRPDTHTHFTDWGRGSRVSGGPRGCQDK